MKGIEWPGKFETRRSAPPETCKETGRDRTKPLLLFVVNVDWFFLSHRLPIALAARDAGLRVIVAAADTGQAHQIVEAGLGFVHVPFSRSGTQPLHEFHTLLILRRLYQNLQPDLIHHVSIKPVLYGSIAVRTLGPIPTVNAISGLGFMFSEHEKARRLRPLTLFLYRLALNQRNVRVIFQNPDDAAVLCRLGVAREEQSVLIRGAGVDCALFRPYEKAPGDLVVMMASRMLWDKGVGEFVGAARLLKRNGIHARFVLVGDSDPGNPTAISRELLRQWHDEGVIEWWGYRRDMHRVLSEAHIFVLPTYYPEGLPKVLLEAAASGLPMVATNVPGCREIVREGETGILVEPRNTGQLAEAIKRLILDDKLRRAYGERARLLAVTEFSVDIVVRQHLELYSKLLGRRLQLDRIGQ